MFKSKVLQGLAVISFLLLPVSALAEQDGDAQAGWIYHDGQVDVTCAYGQGMDPSASTWTELEFCGIDSEAGDALYSLDCSDQYGAHLFGASGEQSMAFLLKLHYGGSVGGKLVHKVDQLSVQSYLPAEEMINISAVDIFAPGNPDGPITSWLDRESFGLEGGYQRFLPSDESGYFGCMFQILIPERTRAVVEAAAVEKKAAINLR